MGGVGYTYLTKNPVWEYEGLTGRKENISWAPGKHELFVDEKNWNNFKWWNWSYENRFVNSYPKSEKFKKITSGSKLYDDFPLNRVCWETYKNKDAKTEEQEDAWRYCSIPGKEPRKHK
ncbi:hypothetical protein [Candidatus Mycoplasma haematohominis]|uniref:Uncharacterized protein n=1 Tax=Candidatus Mycoplasma haematohominis TaxID=1494318 RepID=A0A478FUA4_9MOLU|nr:hypothetical protein [Candidatus Mycoplasma haemohominis]GCE63906.1 hypothetical protein MHSWG343_09130 [Candidatus Mycoplasma haemohominis]